MRLLKILFLLLFVQSVSAQPFIDEIKAFRKQDSIIAPQKDVILLIGSSSFTNWKDVQNYFPDYKMLNRGFGGSSLPDIIRHSDDVIFKYQPKQIIIYCGENDFAANDSLYPAQVAERFYTLFNMIREKFKKVPVVYVSMKPSPSRQHLMAKFNVANVMIKNFLAKKKKTAFIDVYHKMLKPDGTPLTDIFLEDKLHMNAKGYAIWQEVIKPYLQK
jgi:lysophospholipase L1-like esterase